MHHRSRVTDAKGAGALALAVAREQQERLQALLEEARAASTTHGDALHRLLEESVGVATRITAAELRLAECRSIELAQEIVALRERHRALRQQETRLEEQVGALTAFIQRLRVAVQGSKVVTETLAAEGPLQTNGTLVDNVAWRVAQAQEDERQRLARDIHDGPAQALANAIFELEFCERLLDKDPVKLRDEITRLKMDMRTALADVRHFIFGLRPAVLSELGLVATIRRYAEDFEARCGIATTLDLGEPARLAAAQEVTIFRIVQEAIQNTRKHSKASHVSIGLRSEADHIEITIEDDGQGFDPAEIGKRNAGHFGLRGMQERACLIGAKLEVSSQPGSGTKITLLVPQQQGDPRWDS